MDQSILWICGIILSTVALGSCGSGAPSAPSSGSSGSDSGITVTITSVGVSPKQLQVSQGTRVLFVNNDARAHTMNSDPHPDHTDCLELNNIGFISPGQTKETGNLNTIKTCGYHDHELPDDARFKGSITIH